jgi:hypothetical protein
MLRDRARYGIRAGREEDAIALPLSQSYVFPLFSFVSHRPQCSAIQLGWTPAQNQVLGRGVVSLC